LSELGSDSDWIVPTPLCILFLLRPLLYMIRFLLVGPSRTPIFIHFSSLPQRTFLKTSISLYTNRFCVFLYIFCASPKFFGLCFPPTQFLSIFPTSPFLGIPNAFYGVDREVVSPLSLKTRSLQNMLLRKNQQLST